MQERKEDISREELRERKETGDTFMRGYYRGGKGRTGKVPGMKQREKEEKGEKRRKRLNGRVMQRERERTERRRVRK